MSKKSESNGTGGVGLSKLSYFLIVFVAVLYLVSTVLGRLNITWNFINTLIGTMQAVANALMILIVGLLAWRYVSGRSLSIKLLYVLALIVVLVCIVLPVIL